MSSLFSSAFLRQVFAADAAASGALGLLLALDAPMLEPLLGLPTELMRPVGVFLLVWAVVAAALARRRSLARGVVWAVIVFNALWAVESLMALALGWLSPMPLGYGFVVFQAVAVGALAELQFMGLRRSIPQPA